MYLSRAAGQNQSLCLHNALFKSLTCPGLSIRFGVVFRRLGRLGSLRLGRFGRLRLGRVGRLRLERFGRSDMFL